MSVETNGGRTHEPALRELVAELDGFRALMDERDKRYAERDQANKEAVRAALNAAEKAAEKTELALKEYKAGANEWRDTVKDLIAGQRGKGEGFSSGWMLLVSAAALVATLIAVGTFVFKGAPAASVPQVIVVPAPVNAPPTQTTTTTIPAIR